MAHNHYEYGLCNVERSSLAFYFIDILLFLARIICGKVQHTCNFCIQFKKLKQVTFD